MRKRGKKYLAARQQVEERAYGLEEALPLLQKLKFAKLQFKSAVKNNALKTTQ
jgi:hypothetical protein